MGRWTKKKGLCVGKNSAALCSLQVGSAHVSGLLWVDEKARGLVDEGTSGQEGKWIRGQVGLFDGRTS